MRTYNSTELARAFGVSYPTLKKWLSLIPELSQKKRRRVFTPNEIQIIFIALGNPFNWKDAIRTKITQTNSN